MKALIISEDENVYSALNTALINAGYDTIIYKWLLKALDNIEEIQPDCIVVSSSEYPRHWKTLVQFVKSGIGGDSVEVYLYEPKPMSSDDEEKARILGITDYFTSLDGAVLEKIFGKDEFSENLLADEAVPTVENIITEEPVSEKPARGGHFMFTHPLTHRFVTGKFFDFNGQTLSCTISNKEDLNGLCQNCEIEYFTFFDSNKTIMAKVIINNVINVTQNNTFIIVQVSLIYEEN